MGGLRREEGEIEDDELEALRLEQSLGAAHGLQRPGRANPEQAFEIHPAGRGGGGVESVCEVDPGGEHAPLQSLGEEPAGKGGSTRGVGAADLAQAATREASSQPDVEVGEARGQGLRGFGGLLRGATADL
jgi:hypothetical protein